MLSVSRLCIVAYCHVWTFTVQRAGECSQGPTGSSAATKIATPAPAAETCTRLDSGWGPTCTLAVINFIIPSLPDSNIQYICDCTFMYCYGILSKRSCYPITIYNRYWLTASLVLSSANVWQVHRIISVSCRYCVLVTMMCTRIVV